MSVQYTIVGTDEGQQFVSVFIPGRAPMVADDSHPNFQEILAGAIMGDEGVADLFDVSIAAADRFEKLTERVSVANGRLYFDGIEVANELTAQVVRFMREGVDDWKPLVEFFERVADNPNFHSREQLYSWLAADDFTITADGMIVGYKGVHRIDSADGTEMFESINAGTATVNGEVHNGRIPQGIGDIVEMPRNAVQFDPEVGCSIGLHVGTYGYADGFSQGALLEVHVNPRDVVSVPTDCGAQKMRVCRYKVVAAIDAPHRVPVLAGSYDEYDGDEEEYEDEEDYDFTW